MTLTALTVMAQLLTSQAPPALPAVVPVTLKVGEQKVEVLDLGDHLEFKGLAVGKTLCALGRGKLPPRVVELTVEKVPEKLPESVPVEKPAVVKTLIEKAPEAKAPPEKK